MTKNQRARERAVMISSAMPSRNIPVGIAAQVGEWQDRDRGRSGRGRLERTLARCQRRPPSTVLARRALADEADALARDGAYQFCCSPLSPTALRTAVIRLVSVDSETIRPPQTEG